MGTNYFVCSSSASRSKLASIGFALAKPPVASKRDSALSLSKFVGHSCRSHIPWLDAEMGLWSGGSMHFLRLFSSPFAAGNDVWGLRRGVLFAFLLCAFSSGLGADKGEPVLEVDLFVGVDCPIANAYAPEINRLHDAFAPQGVRFRLIYPDTALKDVDVKNHREKFALKPEGVIDGDHSLVKRAGASVTPEVAVFDRQGTLRYRGKIDDRFTDFGDKRRVATERYLDDTLRRLLAGEAVELREVKAVGCLIEPLPQSN